jgi:hypothetical protein
MSDQLRAKVPTVTGAPRGSRPAAAPGRGRHTIVALMGLEALSLAVIASLHLSHVLTGGKKPFRPTAAGIAEAIIGLVLLLAIAALVRRSSKARAIAIATVLFAIAGFVLGLAFTLRGGDTIDIAYHATVVSLLLLTLVLVLRSAAPP